jgi:hypothetical protein
VRHVQQRVRGDQAVGCQSFAPGEAGQMSRTTSPMRGIPFAGLYFSAPVCRSTPVAGGDVTKGVADSTWPVARSITYM